MDGKAIVYCQGAYNTPNGKTAHGLVRFTRRYQVLTVVDSYHAGRDAGDILDGTVRNIPVHATIDESMKWCAANGHIPEYLVVGIAPDGGRITPAIRQDLMSALELGLNIDSGLHDFLTQDHEMIRKAVLRGRKLRDVRKPPKMEDLHFFTGKIVKVDCLKIAILGTDSAIGKRTTAWILANQLNSLGLRTEMIGTGQTAWMQGVKYGIILDSLINDFIAGEIEHIVYTAWKSERPDVLIIEGQGSLLNPAYPGGFEILAAGRPDFVILQHAPRRTEYDGFPGYMIEPLFQQVKAIEIISGKKVLAVSINHEHMSRAEVQGEKDRILRETGLPAMDPLWDSPEKLAELIVSKLPERQHSI